MKAIHGDIRDSGLKSEALRKFLSRELSPSEPRLLSRLLSAWHHPLKLRRGERIGGNSREARYLYFILDGALKAGEEREKGELIYAFAWKGHCMYNLPSWLRHGTSNCYLQAIRTSSLLGIRQDDFEQIKEEFPVLKETWNQQLEYQLRKRVEREGLLLMSSPADRWEHLCKEEPELFAVIPKVHLAAYLGLRPETLSRLPKS